MSASGVTIGAGIGTAVGGPVGAAVGAGIGFAVGILFDIIGLSEQNRLDNLEAELRTREVNFQQQQQSRQIEGQNIATVALRRINYASSGFSQQNLLAIAQDNQYTVAVQDLKDQVRLRTDAIALGQQVKNITASLNFANSVAGRVGRLVQTYDQYQRQSSQGIQKKPYSIDPRNLNHPTARVGTGYNPAIGLPDNEFLPVRTL